MPVKQDSINRDLYGMLKSRGYRPDMFTSAGKKVAVPDEAEAFQFDFVKDGENYGKVTVTVDGLHRLIVYYGDDVEDSPKTDGHDSESFNSLRLHLKRFAKNKQLGFELSDIDDLEPDMAKREHIKKDKLAEGYYALGKTKSYSDNVPSTKIILQHSRQIEEGEQRYRNIAKIFVENANGERFLVPTNKPGLARVYARHIAEGGTPYDERGQHITSLCEEYNKMAGFVRATKNKQFNESVQSLINEGVNHYGKLRETLHKMAGKRGYNEYFENYTPALMEDEGADLSEMFMQSSLDPRIESVMPILSKLSKNISETKLKEVDELSEWADNIIEGGMNDDANFGKLPASQQASPKAVAKAKKIIQQKADQNIIGMAKMTGTIPEPLKEVDDEEDDGLIAGRYTQDEWDSMVNRVKHLAHKQEAEKRKSQEHEQPVKEDDYDPFSFADNPEADAKHEADVFAKMKQQQQQGKGTSLKNMNPLDRNQYLQTTNRTWDEKTQRSVPSQPTQQPQNEGLDEADMAVPYKDEWRGISPTDIRGQTQYNQRGDQLDKMYGDFKTTVPAKQSDVNRGDAKVSDYSMSVKPLPPTRQQQLNKTYGDFTSSVPAKQADVDAGDTDVSDYSLSRGVSTPKLPRVQNEEVDMGQADARKSVNSAPKGDWDKDFREKLKQYTKELEQRQKEKKEKGVSEDLDSNQKSAGQLGPTEKVKNNNIGKLVGANESIDPVLKDIKRLSGL